MLESIVLDIYLWFNIYFLIDTNTKTWTEITDLVVFRKKLLKFLQGVSRWQTSLVFHFKWHGQNKVGNIATPVFRRDRAWFKLLNSVPLIVTVIYTPMGKGIIFAILKLIDPLGNKSVQNDYNLSKISDIHRFSNRKWVWTMCAVGNLWISGHI